MQTIIELQSFASIKLQILTVSYGIDKPTRFECDFKSLPLTDFSQMDFGTENDQEFFNTCLNSFDQQNSLEQTLKRVSRPIQPKNSASKGCICKKTKCVKMYCECFSQGKTCTQDCSCFNCENTESNKLSSEAAHEELKSKKKQQGKESQGCNCQKSNCTKKYCECFQAGKHCGASCRCNDCHNVNQLDDTESLSSQSFVGL